QQAYDAAFGSQVAQDIQSLRVERMFRDMVPFLAYQVNEVCKRSGRPHGIARFAKRGEALLVKAASHDHVSLLERHIALVIERPRNAAPVAQSAEDRPRLLVQSARYRIITLRGAQVGQVAETACQRGLISEL